MSITIQDSSTLGGAAPAAGATGAATSAGAPSSPPLVTPSVASPAATQEFEKAQVTTIITKVSGATAVDSFDQTVSIDDRIRVVGEFKVTKISHEVQKDGGIARVQHVAPCGDLQLVPWDSSDPTDQGIVRARP